jgi:hypothetical protein
VVTHRSHAWVLETVIQSGYQAKTVSLGSLELTVIRRGRPDLCQLSPVGSRGDIHKNEGQYQQANPNDDHSLITSFKIAQNSIPSS